MFSKYDVYTTVQSMYCYPDTDVLINKFGIRDKAELKQAEEEFTAVWCCTIKVDIENSKSQYIEKDKQEATKDGSESTKI